MPLYSFACAAVCVLRRNMIHMANKGRVRFVWDTQVESPVTSPEMSRRRYNRHHHAGGHNHNHGHHHHMQRQDMGSSFLSEPESSSAAGYHGPRPASAAAGSSRFSNSRSAHEFGRGLYLELEHGDNSPPSDNVLFDNQVQFISASLMPLQYS